MKIDGNCHCGAISYEAEADTEKVGICHCTDCQKFSGGPFRIGVAVPEKNFVLLSGEPKTYIKTAESGRKRAQIFCPNCGTHIYSTSVGDEPKIFRIRTPTSNQLNHLVPTTQGWHSSAQKWIKALQTIPSREKQ